MSKVINFLRDESGPTSVEYAILLALIIAGIITAITTVGAENGSMMDANATALTEAFNR